MAVSTDTVARKYLNPVAATPISVDIPVTSKAYVYVYISEAGEIAVQDTDYTVTLNTVDYSNFTITPTASLRTKIDAAVADGGSDFITVRRILPYLSDITPELAFFRAKIAQEFDNNTMRAQQLAEKVGRCLRLPETDVSGMDTSIPAPEANALIGWNATADGLANYAGAPDVVVSSAMSPVVQAATLADARTAMAVLGTAVAASTYETQAHAASTYATKANPAFTGTLTHEGSRLDIRPTVQKFTSGSGTYTTPANCKYIRVTMVGGGGGGSRSGSGTPGSGGAGGNTTFGTSLLTANGGGGGVAAAVGGTAGGAGGSASLGAAAGLAVSGGTGTGSGFNSSVTIYQVGGAGAASALGGAGGGGPANLGGHAATANTGGGGGGAGSNQNASISSGSGGGSGGFISAIINSPASTYSYAVGAAGTAGTAGTNGYAGGAGGSGIIVIEEFYNY